MGEAMKPAIVIVMSFALAASMSAPPAAAKPTQPRAQRSYVGQIHPRWNSPTLAYYTLYATASNQGAIAQCRHQYGGNRGSQGYIMRPYWIEQCYHEKTGKFPWQ